MKLLIILVIYTIVLFVVVRKLLPSSLFVNVDIDSDHFLYNGKKWFEYRLGDLYYNPHLVDTDLHAKRFPYSIATEYTHSKDIKKIINDRLLRKSDLILHLRIGDVVDKYISFHQKQYFKDQEWWDALLAFISKNEIKRVILMAGAHMPECLEKSWEYLESKKAFFQKNGIKTLYRLTCSPDEDILYCARAKYFATTGGQYGNFLSEIIQGTVFKPN
jgi:hypothetical protein